jgi:hypothetical protein
MLARTESWDDREFRRSKYSGLIDTLTNPDFLAVCLFSALGLLITAWLAIEFPLDDASSLILQFG